MTGRLYFVLKSPGEDDPFELIDALGGGAGNGVLLVEDGVYHAALDKYRNRMLDAGLKVYAMGEDLKAKGFGAPEGVEVVDYPRAMDLIMEEYGQVVNA